MSWPKVLLLYLLKCIRQKCIQGLRAIPAVNLEYSNAAACCKESYRTTSSPASYHLEIMLRCYKCCSIFTKLVSARCITVKYLYLIIKLTAYISDYPVRRGKTNNGKHISSQKQSTWDNCQFIHFYVSCC